MNEQRAQTHHGTVHSRQIWRPPPRPILDQKLMFDEQCFGDHGPRPTRPQQSSQGRQQMDQEHSMMETANAAETNQHT